MSEVGDSRFWRWLERCLPWLGTPGLLKAVVLLNALTFLLLTLDPAYAGVLALVPQKILEGEVWRLVTYIFVPETQSFFWVVFFLLFLWFISSGLEEFWGPLRLNVFYLVGMIGSTVAAFFFGGGTSNTFLNLSLFFAFATIAPNYEIFLLFVLRIKIKYLAMVLAGVYALQFVVLPADAKMAMVASMANYLLFFGPGFIRDLRDRGTTKARRQKFEVAPEETLHRCATCGRTEVAHPELEFRVTDSGEEFCLEHLPGR